MKLKQQLDCASKSFYSDDQHEHKLFKIFWKDFFRFDTEIHVLVFIVENLCVCEIMFYLLFSPTAGGCSAYLGTHLFRLHHPGLL